LNDSILDHHSGGSSELGEFRHRLFRVREGTSGDADEDRLITHFRASRGAAVARHLFFE
jgi:hypothetical protein